MDENAGGRVRRLRASLDTGDQESAELPLEEVPLNPVGQGRRRRQDAGGADQSWAKPQERGEEEQRASLSLRHVLTYEPARRTAREGFGLRPRGQRPDARSNSDCGKQVGDPDHQHDGQGAAKTRLLRGNGGVPGRKEDKHPERKHVEL